MIAWHANIVCCISLFRVPWLALSGEANMKKVLATLLTKAQRGGDHCVIGTKNLFKVIKKCSGQDIANVMHHWIFWSGCAVLTANFNLNRKRNHIEFGMRLNNKVCRSHRTCRRHRYAHHIYTCRTKYANTSRNKIHYPTYRHLRKDMRRHSYIETSARMCARTQKHVQTHIHIHIHVGVACQVPSEQHHIAGA